jgi:hypothetical protein
VGSLVPEDRRRVFLPTFRNNTLWRDLEIELTRQVERELASRPGMFIVGREEADIVLSGTIVDFRQQVVSEDTRNRVRESAAITTVRIEIVDARDPHRVLRSYQVRDRSDFYIVSGDALAAAQTDSYLDLARLIVDGLEGDIPRATRPGSKPEDEEAIDA